MMKLDAAALRAAISEVEEIAREFDQVEVRYERKADDHQFNRRYDQMRQQEAGAAKARATAEALRLVIAAAGQALQAGEPKPAAAAEAVFQAIRDHLFDSDMDEVRGKLRRVLAPGDQPARAASNATGDEGETASEVEKARKAWDAACHAWSQDPATDAQATMKLGEGMMFAATALICALEAAEEAARGDLREAYLGADHA